MPAQSLYRKWRPQLWDEVVGQDHVVQTLRNALRTDHIAHAYLFAGPRGCGKTTSARLIAKALNCLHSDAGQRPCGQCDPCVAVAEGRFLDLIEIDGASNNSVDNVRELRDKINFAPGLGRYKIYIIDEVHMLSSGAFNALLKTLEEPPSHAVFILATTELHKIPATVISRCQRFEFRRIPVAEIVYRLKTMCQLEGIVVEEAALEVIARQATGALRDAISLLDQLVAADAQVTLAQAQALLGTSTGHAVQSLVDALAGGDMRAGLMVVNQAIDSGADPRQLARQVVDYARNLMLVRLGNAALVEATAEVRAVLARQAERFEAPALLRLIRAFNTAANDARGGWQPQLPLELAVVESLAPAPTVAAQPAAVPAATTAVSTAAPATVAPTPQPPVAVTEPKAPAPTRPGRAPTDPGDLKTVWSRVLALVDKPTAALLRSCKVLGMEGNALRVSTNDFVYKQLTANAPTRQRIEAALSEVLGATCVLKCETSTVKRGKTNPDIPKDGLVATALDLGGELIE